MAFNPAPEIKVARDVAEKYGFDEVIIVGLRNDYGSVSYQAASYGKSKAQCAEAAKICDAFVEALEDLFGG